MGLIEKPKTYTGRDLETIFFRPMFAGQNAEQLGIRVMYNMPVPTTIQMWSPNSDVLKAYSSGWTGGDSASRVQKSIEMSKLKAEVGFSASDYFQSVYELITGRADVNLDDLTGSELEQAETEMFRAAIAESLRVMMWIGDKSAAAYNTMDGILTRATRYSAASSDVSKFTGVSGTVTADNVIDLLKGMWTMARPELKALRGEGNLTYFVTTDIYDAYEEYLDNHAADGAYVDLVSGHRELSYHGIKIVDMGITQYITKSGDAPSYCLLTDRRNLVLAVNTSDYPGSEVRMWYNPDAMENRQRAVFLAGTEILDETLMVWAQL